MLVLIRCLRKRAWACPRCPPHIRDWVCQRVAGTGLQHHSSFDIYSPKVAALFFPRDRPNDSRFDECISLLATVDIAQGCAPKGIASKILTGNTKKSRRDANKKHHKLAIWPIYGVFCNAAAA